jgi:hypothetical protein
MKKAEAGSTRLRLEAFRGLQSSGGFFIDSSFVLDRSAVQAVPPHRLHSLPLFHDGHLVSPWLAAFLICALRS